MPLIGEIAFTIVALLAFALAGRFVLIPFYDGHRFLSLLAPSSGILILSLIVGLLYSVSGKSFDFCVIAGFAITCSITIATLFKWRPSREELVSVGVTMVVIGTVVTLFGSSTTIRFGSPGILFIDGTDHAGYAQVADWLRAHTINEAPALSPDKPYESWPNWMFQSDPRFASFTYLAIMSRLHRLPGLFAYDSAFSVALTAGFMSVAGAFSRTRKTLILVTACLLLNGWMAMGRQGYLGKILGYPSALMIGGLTVNSTKRDAAAIAALCLLTVCTAVCHAGVATALVLIVTVGAQSFTRSRQSKDELFLALLLPFIALAASGTFAFPRAAPNRPLDMDWGSALATALDIDTGYRFVSHAYQHTGLILAILLQVVLIACAVRWKSWTACALAVAPVILLGALRLDDQKWITYQLVGIPYALAICTAACLLDQTANSKRRTRIVVAMMVAMALVRAPVMPRMLGRYLISPPTGLQYLLSEFDTLQQTIGDKPVEIDISDPNPAVPVLVEFGRRKLDVQWCEPGWKRVVGQFNWPLPKYSERPSFYLSSKLFPTVTGTPILSTDRFVLYHDAPKWKDSP